MKSKLSTAFINNEIERIKNIADKFSRLSVYGFTLMNGDKKAVIDDETIARLNEQNLLVQTLKRGLEDVADNLTTLKEDSNA